MLYFEKKWQTSVRSNKLVLKSRDVKMTSEFEEIGNWFLLPQVLYTSQTQESRMESSVQDFILIISRTVVDTSPCIIYRSAHTKGQVARTCRRDLLRGPVPQCVLVICIEILVAYRDHISGPCDKSHELSWFDFWDQSQRPTVPQIR